MTNPQPQILETEMIRELLGLGKQTAKRSILINPFAGATTEEVENWKEMVKVGGGRIYHMKSIDGREIWGNTICYSGKQPSNVGTGTILHVIGFKPRRPRVGDLLRGEMASGHVGLSQFIKLRYCDNPGDMFYGDVKMLAYDFVFESERQ